MASKSRLAYTATPALSGGGGPPLWPRHLLDRWRTGRSRRDAAHGLYTAIVEQARQPVFYGVWGVPDSREGRLEMVNLHAILVMRRLRAEGPEGQAVAQALFDLMFQDLDRHLREWGVGDLSVGKHVKKLAQSFFGRAAALDPLLLAGDASGVEEVLRRNVYTGAAEPLPMAIGRLTHYLLEQEAFLQASDGAALVAGQARFAAAEDPG
jgi:cytochrome b pre-mRNA-processing protein 3